MEEVVAPSLQGNRRYARTAVICGVPERLAEENRRASRRSDVEPALCFFFFAAGRLVQSCARRAPAVA
eukprot:11224543-Lingulodinium_polyedra.AAC.1